MQLPPFVLTALVAIAATRSPAVAQATPVPAPLRTFLDGSCTECHDADYSKGDLDLTALRFDLDDANVFATWAKVHDRVSADEMPPAAEARPEAAARSAFLAALSQALTVADRERVRREGRAVRRRLNRLEYEDTLRDLFDIPGLEVKDILPEDGEAFHFNKLGEALDVSHVNVSRYMSAADSALRQAMATQIARPPRMRQRYHARDQRGFRGAMRQGPPVRQAFPLVGYKAEEALLKRGATLSVGPANPALRNREAVALASSTYEPSELRYSDFRAPHSGFYRLRFATYSIWIADKTPKDTFWLTDRSRITPGRRSEPIVVYADWPPNNLRRVGSFDSHPRSTVAEMTVWLNAGETVRPDAARLVRSRPPDFRNPLKQDDGLPAVAHQWMEVDGPLIEQWPPRGHQLLFGDLPLKSADGTIKVEPHAPRQDAERLLRGLLARAYRLPATAADEARFLAVYDHAIASGYDFTEAMLAMYTAVLSSPSFLYVDEAPGPLAGAALATRLSYFLWNTAPDAELMHAARTGKLGLPEELRRQTERLLRDPRSRRFVNNFLDHWLELRKIMAAAPDASLYPDYQLDDLLLESMIEEPQLYFSELLRRDLGAEHVAASNFTMLNERLAAHYGIPGVKGVKLRKVRLPTGSVRGGLMTTASVLKVTANGTTTSPVVRGVWIMDRILGKRPPAPPPSVPAVEPDTTGATTIREQLAKHRTVPSCAACHRDIDPPGFALESFDPMGGFRERYRAIGGGEPLAGAGHDGQLFTFSFGPSVESHGELPDGRSFRNVREFKALLVADREQLARNLLEQLAIYATGAPIRFSDRPTIDAILERTRRRGHGVRSLIHEIVASDLFRNK